MSSEKTKKTETEILLGDISDKKIEALANSLTKLRKQFNCYYIYEPTYQKADNPLPECFIDNRKAILIMNMRKKEFFKLIQLPICNQDKQQYEFKCCSAPEIPFLIAPCQFMNKMDKCPFYIVEIDPQNTEEEFSLEKEIFKDHSKQQIICENYSKQILKSINKADAKCFICKNQAEYISVFGSEEKYVCKRHSKLHKCALLPTSLAICDLLESQKDCVGFE